MNKFKKLKSAIISFCKPKKLTSLAVALTTIFAMLPVANISASAATNCGLDEIGGKVLIESSKTPLVLIDNGIYGKLDAYKFEFNGQTGYCIDPQLPAQRTDGQTLEFTEFSGDTGKEVLKLDPNSSNQKEKALIAGLSVFYGGYGDYFSRFSNGGKTAKSIMDGYITGGYGGYFNKMSKVEDKYYYLSHYALSQLYHEFKGDSGWKTWSGYTDITVMINGLVSFANSIAKSTGDYSAIQRSCATNNYYITQPKGKDGTFCQHLIVRIPKKAKLSLQKSGSNEEIKNLSEATKDKDYLNFAGTQYTLYKRSNNERVAVAELDGNGNIAKILYSYSNKEWITKNYFELDAGEYYLKETQAPNNGKYFTLDTTEYPIKVTPEDCIAEKRLDVLKVTDIEKVRLNLKKESSNPKITNGNDCYDLNGAIYGIYSSGEDAVNKTNALRYLITGADGKCKAISANGNTWDYDVNSPLYYIAYSDSLYAAELEAPQGYYLNNNPVKLEITGSTYGGFVVLEALGKDRPAADPIRIRVFKTDTVTGNRVYVDNAEFTITYYSGYHTTSTELADTEETRQWIIKTKADEYYAALLGEAFRADSDLGQPFYYEKGNPDACIPLGTVTIQETKAPTGYKLNNTVFLKQIVLDENGNPQIVSYDPTTGEKIPSKGSIELDNEIEVLEEPDVVYGNLTIYKTADDSKRGANTAKDVWFNVKSDDGVTDENIVTKSKGIDGAATLSNLPVYKASGEYVNYTIKELGYKNADGTYSVPDRYVPPVERTVTLKENVTLSFYFANRLQKTGLIVQKESEDGIVSGFYFSVKSDDGKTNKVLVTGEDGTAQLTNLAVYNTSNEKVKYTIDELGFKNADGTYYFPAKYVKPAAQTFTLEDGKSFVVTMKNLLKRGSVELLKTDGNGNPLEGIEFELYNTKTGIVNVINKNSSIMYEVADSKTADTVTKLVTDSDGRIIVNNLLPGDYYFIETDSKGNMPYAGKINFTISPDSLDTLDIQLTVKNNSVFIPETGGTGNNRPIYIEIGAAVLAFTILVGAIGLGIRKKKKHIGKKAQQ